MKYVTYNIALINLLLQALGDGFSKTLFFDSEEKGGTVNNFKQKVHKMNKGSLRTSDEIYSLLDSRMRRFVDGKNADESAAYCHKKASDKYNDFYWVLISNFRRAYSLSTARNFFYEKDEDVLAYLVAEWIVPSCARGEHPDVDPVYGNKEKEFLDWREEAFRPEYYTAIYDVVTNSKENKTFYKWVIDDFYENIGNKADSDKILKHSFGENRDTNEISTTFEKMKYEPGIRTWNTIDSLVQNEWNDNALMKTLKLNGEYLRIYQIFQARMLVAYLFENLRAILQNSDFMGEANYNKLSDLICKKISNPETKFNFKEIFLSSDYENKTRAYEQKVFELMNDDFNPKEDSLSELDSTCPATEFFKNFIQVENWNYRHELTEDEYNQILSKCREHIKYLGNFAHYRVFVNDVLIF